MALPTGTVTFLFTDIEGSTVRWERYRADMADALARHDALLRAAIEEHNGYIFKNVGDAVCAAFAHASDAVVAARVAQRALAEQDFSSVDGLSVRMAIHSGEAIRRDGDYFGPTLNRVTRLLAVGHGGQILISGTAEKLLEGILPVPLSLRDLGKHRLKDLSVPERVYQLVAPDLAVEFPPLRSLDASPNNLPLQVTRLFGRDEAVAQVKALVEANRLVTLVGTGGVGKTRLALQAAADLVEAFADGAWFVELAPLGDRTLVANAIAAVFGVREAAGGSVLQALSGYLKTRRTLIVLDNCEHLIAEAANVAAALLRTCAQVSVLATSRAALDVAGEHVYQVPPLEVPPADQPLASEELQRYGATALFVERARRVVTQFAVDDNSAMVVGDICRRLDGIPLAIELAAARVRVLGLGELARHLEERLRILTGGSRTALPRQQTMRALIDWSYDLLTASEQSLFRRLSIFAGGWTLEASESVCDDGSLGSAAMLELLSSLVEKSLVIAELSHSSSRYRLLESTRAYAAEKLAQSGQRAAIAGAHARWIGVFASRAYETRGKIPSAAWLAGIAPELENVREALRWSFASGGDGNLGAQIAGALTPFWFAGGLVGEGRRWLQVALSQNQPDTESLTVARLWLGLAYLTSGSQGRDAATRAVTLHERLEDRFGLARSLAALAWALKQMGRLEEADAASERALNLWREIGKGRSFEYAGDLDARATILAALGRYDEARAALGEVASLFEALGQDEAAAISRMNLAEIEFASGSTNEALKLALDAADSLLRLQSVGRATIALTNAAGYYLALGAIDEARVKAREVLRIARRSQIDSVVFSIQHLAAVLALGAEPRRAACLLGYVNAWYRRTGYEREPTERRSYEILSNSLQQQLSEGELATLMAEGAALSEDRAIDEALDATRTDKPAADVESLRAHHF